MSDRRYPFSPLAAAMGLTESGAVHELGIGGSRAKRLRSEGLTVELADRFAGRAHLHPAEVWPSWFDDALEDHGSVCAADGCEQRFIPARSTRRFCTPACAQRERYRTSEADRQRRIEARRAYYAENGDYERARERRRYRAQRDAA